MEKNDKIKDMSIYEASDFWDEHDFGEFDDVKEVEEIKFSLKKKKVTWESIVTYMPLSTSPCAASF